ncbi:hypothetical protein Tco_0891949 [Tanacetum coccineum]|uniref:Uncharacterized protein n=1 Tax=Tanacetum coccineum TaxID=301880 RepID=A0ABQ5C6C9_9ASTR
MTKRSTFVNKNISKTTKKYEISNSFSVKTPMLPPNNLGLGLSGKLVNETLYRGMIGSLMYLTASQHNIQFSTCFGLKGYLDSDYVGCNMDRKSTSGACQLLGGKLVCWSAKKQQLVAMCSAEVEYVTTARSRGGRGVKEKNTVIAAKDVVFSTWMAFGGNTRDLGSFGEETDEITDLHQILEKILLTGRGDGVAGIKRRRRDPSSDDVR